MSEFHNDPTYPKARKPHRCSPCGYPIAIGEQYVQQTGFYEGEPYRCRYHQECWDDLSAEGIFEFSPGDGEPPPRLLEQPHD